MQRRLVLIDANSLFTTAQSQYRGKLDFSFLKKRIQEESGSLETKCVVFHGEPRKGGSQAFQDLLKGFGYQVVVVRSRALTGSTIDVRCIPLHVVSYLLPQVGKFTHVDIVSGDVDYSPVTAYLMGVGIYVRMWLFADRIPVFGQDEEVFHSIVPINERYILSEASHTEDAYREEPRDSRSILGLLESPHEGQGIVEFGGDPQPTVSPPEDLQGEEARRRDFEQASAKGEKLGLAVDLGTASKTGCEEI